eukprot:scaffold289221_cov19-Tisochrysis_lutea.AAC.2
MAHGKTKRPRRAAQCMRMHSPFCKSSHEHTLAACVTTCAPWGQKQTNAIQQGHGNPCTSRQPRSLFMCNKSTPSRLLLPAGSAR